MPVPVGFYEATFMLVNNASPRVCTTALAFKSTQLVPHTAAQAATDILAGVTGTGELFGAGEMIDDYTFQGVNVAFGTVTGDVLAQALTTVVGTLVDASPPMNCAVLINKNTALGGRKYRGRMFMPPCHLNEGAVDAAGNLTSGAVSNMNARLVTSLASWVLDDLSPVLLHQGVSPPAPTDITGLTCQSLIGTQRRRMRS